MTEDRLFLPEQFDGTTAPQVTEALLAHRGQAVELDAARVKSAGTLGLQVLVAARKQWAADDSGFRVITPSDAFMTAALTIGLDPVEVGVPAGHEVSP